MEVRTYKDLRVWQNAMDLALSAYRVTEQFPNHELYGLTSQLRRAAVSVPANIAEGQGRWHRRAFVNFLNIVRGSLAEVQTHLEIAYRLGYLRREQLDGLLSDATVIAKMLNALKSALSRKARPNDQSPITSP